MRWDYPPLDVNSVFPGLIIIVIINLIIIIIIITIIIIIIIIIIFFIKSLLWYKLICVSNHLRFLICIILTSPPKLFSNTDTDSTTIIYVHLILSANIYLKFQLDAVT